MSFLGRGDDSILMALVEESGSNIQRSAELLRDLLV